MSVVKKRRGSLTIFNGAGQASTNFIKTVIKVQVSKLYLYKLLLQCGFCNYQSTALKKKQEVHKFHQFEHDVDETNEEK